MEKLAPIVLFTFNRPQHTSEVLENLKKCKLANQSDLIIFCDGPRKDTSSEESGNIKAVRDLVNNIPWESPKKVYEADQNLGLANSIIKGVSKVLETYATAIILEDDVIVGENFLEYMNHALLKYQEESNVKMISGYFFPVEKVKENNACFLLNIASTQAWAVWKDKWKDLKKYPEGYESLKSDSALRSRFNLDGNFDYTTMLLNEMESEDVSSWAIRLNWNIFKSGYLVLYPDKSLIKNIGWDGSGRHCSDNNPFLDLDWNKDYAINTFPDNIQEDKHLKKLTIEYIKSIYKTSLKQRVLNKIQKMFSWN